MLAYPFCLLLQAQTSYWLFFAVDYIPAMIRRFFKFIAKILFWIVLCIGIYAGINFFFPKMTREKLSIGHNAGNSFFEYTFDSREEHISYMESLKTDYGTLRYLDRGKRDAPVVLLLHGPLGSSRERRHITARLLDRGYRVIVPDLLGYGISESTNPSLAHVIDRQWPVVMRLMYALGINKRSEVVHDWSSLILWNQIKDITINGTPTSPQITHAIIVNAPGYTNGYTPPRFVNTHPLLTSAWAYLASLPLWSKYFLKLLFYHDIPQIHAMGDAMIQWYAKPYQLHSWRNYMYIMTHLDDYNNLLDVYQSMYKNFKTPLRIIRSTTNMSFDSRQQLPFFKTDFSLTDNDIITLPWGHYLQEESPGKLAQTIDDIIKQ